MPIISGFDLLRDTIIRYLFAYEAPVFLQTLRDMTYDRVIFA
jgi:hypothetical protein